VLFNGTNIPFAFFAYEVCFFTNELVIKDLFIFSKKRVRFHFALLRFAALGPFCTNLSAFGQI